MPGGKDQTGGGKQINYYFRSLSRYCHGRMQIYRLKRDILKSGT